ncbi:hypothetical protein BH20ACI4_BH20ACI4_09440 [soil metagenome]
MKRNLIITTVLCGMALISACGGGGGGGNTNDPNIGFFIQADRYERSQTTGTTLTFPTAMRIDGRFLEPQGTIVGTLETANGDVYNLQHFPMRKVPAKWRFTYFELPQPGRIPCSPLGGITERNVHKGEVEKLRCDAIVFPITVAPSLIDGQSPPSKIDIQVEGINNEHAPPQVAILDERRNLKASMPATILNLGKGNVQIDTPAMNQFRNGRYQISISNVRADGSWNTIGVAQIFIFNLIDPNIPIDPDPCLNQAPQCLF